MDSKKKEIRKQIIKLLEEGDKSLADFKGLEEEFSRQLINYHLKKLVKEGEILAYSVGSGIEYSERFFTPYKKEVGRISELIDRIPENEEAEKEFIRTWISRIEQVVNYYNKPRSQPIKPVRVRNDLEERYFNLFSEVGYKLIYGIKLGILDKKVLSNITFLLSFTPGDLKNKDNDTEKELINELSRIESFFNKKGINLNLRIPLKFWELKK